MGIFGWLKPEEEPKDRSLVEISNDKGDHWVADVPSKSVRDTEKALRDAGVSRDKDEQLSERLNPAAKFDKRNHEEYRYQTEKVVDPNEDLEDSHDRENDRSDYEPDSDREADSCDDEESEQTAWRWW